MKIAVVGAGNGGCAVAADLSMKGHEVTLIKTSASMHNENFQYLLDHDGAVRIDEKGQVRTTNIAHVTKELSAITEAKIIIVYIQTNYHEELMKRMAEYLADGQIVLINPGYLSTAYLLKYSAGRDITIVEAESSFLDCRILEPGYIKVGFRNVRNPLGVYPVKNLPLVQADLEALGFPFVYLSSVVEAALHNPNLIVHTVGAIMSMPRIEKTNGDYIMYHEVFTPSVWKVLEKLDSEKMDVLEKLGFPRLSYVEACKYRNTLDETQDAKEVFFWYAAMPTRAKGPVKVNSRYITEDVPEGLVMLEALGKQLGVATPVCSSLIEIASAALERDMREQGRTPERLGVDNLKKILADKI
ncbi:NAD/NADP-dependent octopine/nopaline dehydrogenase family protein [Planomicrobium sp. YIM 101495]|uniref:NAD/NADP-dependent octopine/nopaline dehydrogenase family protein n=1 Tax=Planomicrobium sp. YIM 101495 TaxID=2665160 RepID=UPI0012B92D0E|nr:NAD/NADP-dependent octopine/nopaline dehydrogenase family protein [Planomicrobium sp. YIM 101495]MTD31920.1 NAD/NADP octopine/nopaline dehydrogenase [Planomicrobium sp. YIM 101495]